MFGFTLNGALYCKSHAQNTVPYNALFSFYRHVILETDIKPDMKKIALGLFEKRTRMELFTIREGTLLAV